MYEFILWFIFIIIVIIAIIALIFFHIKQYALFQATRDQKWYPEEEKCEHLSTEGSGGSQDSIIREVPECRDYTKEFTDCYLIIGDKKHKAFSRQEIINISNQRTFNIGDLHYINIWKFEQFPGQRVVLYFHGNNDNISYRKYVIDICHALKLNLILADYRGYGDSAALPNSHFLLEDAKTAYKHVRNNYDAEEIIIWGESLGGIAAIWTAHKYESQVLILLSTFADTRTIIDKLEVNKHVKRVLKKLAKSKLMNNGNWIKDVTVPTVIIHSPDDDILPYVNAELLYNSVGASEKKLINISGPHSHPYFEYDNLVDLLKFIHIDDDIIRDNDKINKILDIVNNL